MTVLGSLVLQQEGRLDAIEILTPEMFSDERARTAFDAIRAMVVDGRPIDLVSLVHELDMSNKLDKAGGVDFLAETVEKFPGADIPEGYARRLERSTRRRRLLASIGKAHRDVSELGDEAMDPASLWATIVGDANLSEGERRVWWMRDLLAGWDPASQKKSLSEKGLPVSGIAPLDDNISIFKPANFTVLAARPAMGKSTLMRQWAWHASDKGPVVIFTLEESKEAVRDKMVCMIAQVPYWKWHKGMASPEDEIRMVIAAGNVAERDIGVYGGYSAEAAHIRLAIRRLQQQGREPVAVFIDHLNLMRHPKAENRDAAVGETTRLLRLIALETGVPSVLLCQMNRAQEGRGQDEKRPRLADLRESGMVEANAPNVLFIWKQGDFDSDEHTLTVAKHRDGPTTEMPIVFLREQGRFQPTAKPEHFR